jgi:hypothetical protein
MPVENRNGAFLEPGCCPAAGHRLPFHSVNWNEMGRNESSCRRIDLRNQWDLHPEWGYLAPSPGFIRTARAVVLATVFGAIVGASLIAWVSHSATETSVAARTLVNAPEPRPAPSTGQDHVVHAIIPAPQSTLASGEDPSVNEIATELSAGSTIKASEAGTGKSSSAAKPIFTARLPRVHFTRFKKPAYRTSRYASRHEPMSSRGQYYRRSSDEYRASDARAGYYHESRH